MTRGDSRQRSDTRGSGSRRGGERVRRSRSGHRGAESHRRRCSRSPARRGADSHRRSRSRGAAPRGNESLRRRSSRSGSHKAAARSRPQRNSRGRRSRSRSVRSSDRPPPPPAEDAPPLPGEHSQTQTSKRPRRSGWDSQEPISAAVPPPGSAPPFAYTMPPPMGAPLHLGAPGDEILVESNLVQFLLGKRGETVATIEKDTGAIVKVDRSMDATRGYAICRIYGAPQAVSAAGTQARLKLAGISDKIELPPGYIAEEREMSDHLIKCVMGRGGKNVKEIHAQTNVEIQVKGFASQSWVKTANGNFVMRVVGTRGAVDMANALMVSHIHLWDDFRVDQRLLKRSLGPGGATLRRLKEQSGAQIRIDSLDYEWGVVRIKDPGTTTNVQARQLLQEVLPEVDFSPGAEIPATIDYLAPLVSPNPVQLPASDGGGINGSFWGPFNDNGGSSAREMDLSAIAPPMNNPLPAAVVDTSAMQPMPIADMAATNPQMGMRAAAPTMDMPVALPTMDMPLAAPIMEMPQAAPTMEMPVQGVVPAKDSFPTSLPPLPPLPWEERSMQQNQSLNAMDLIAKLHNAGRYH